MIGFGLFIALALTLAYFVFSPQLKGFRTQLVGYATVIGGGLLPVATDITGYLQSLDWRQYILEGDKKNYAILAVTAGLGILMIILRQMTTGPVGTKS